MHMLFFIDVAVQVETSTITAKIWFLILKVALYILYTEVCMNSEMKKT